MTAHFVARLTVRLAAVGVVVGVIMAGAAPAMAHQGQSRTTRVASTVASPRIPLDTAVHMGTLPNGLRYYIRHVAHPAGRALFDLSVNVGSVLEDDDQRGLAHFVEHAAFNGSTHFPNHKLWEALPKMGLQIGADVNATTGDEETNYTFQMPTEPAIVDTALLILSDIAHEVTFTAEEVAHERGIIFEERRLRQDATLDPHQVVLYGARYATRSNAIGFGETILHAPASVIERFYRDWYRPDLQTVIVVGDIDPSAVEAKVIATFGRIPMPLSPRVRPPRHRMLAYDTAVVSVSDHGGGHAGGVRIAFRAPPPDSVVTEATVRQQVVDQLCRHILNARFDALSKVAKAPIQSASLELELGEPTSLSLQTRESIMLEVATTRVVAEMARLSREGPAPAELTLARRQLIAKTVADTLVALDPGISDLDDVMLTAASEHSAIVDQRAKGRFILQVLPTITVAEVQAVAARILATRGPVVMVNVPQDDPYGLPGSDMMLAAFKAGFTHTFPPIVLPQDTTPALLATHPRPGHIVQERVVPSLGVTAWTLSNGAHVLLKPTQTHSGYFSVSATSLGGVSVASDREYPSAAVASTLVGMSGLGPYDRETLTRSLGRQIYGWSASIDPNTVWASFGGSSQHGALLFQLLDLAFTAPRLDAARVAKWRLEERQQKFEGSDIELLRATSQHNPRVRPIIGAIVDSVDTAAVLRFYRESFGDAGHFTFVIVGDFNVDSLRPLVEEYIGGLSGHPYATPYRGRDLGIRFPNEIVQRSTGTSDSISKTTIEFEAMTPVTPHREVVAQALSTILEQRIMLRLRQQLSGAYSPTWSCGLEAIPYAHGVCAVKFTSAPERAEELKDALFALIDTLRTQGVTPTEVQEARLILQRTHALDIQNDGYWNKLLQTTVTEEESLDDLATWTQQTQTVTAAEINGLLRTLLTPNRYVQVTSLPVRMLPMRVDEMQAVLQW